jgi:hypothetical protein
MRSTKNADVSNRIDKLDWTAIRDDMLARGYAMTSPILSAAQCKDVAQMFNDDQLFRSVTNMAHKRFGSGTYKYFKYPLPDLIVEMRETLYEHVAPIANLFNEQLRVDERYPAQHADLIKMCNRQKQMRPTPLVLHYEGGDFNCLHQDVYGNLTFPLQVTVFLSEPGTDYTGGEFLLYEQMPRAQARVHVIKPERGQMILFTTRYRPECGARGFRRVNVKHGVATVESGKRDTLGIIFHDAQ